MHQLRISEELSPDDHMNTADLSAYMRTSRSALEAILHGLEAAKRSPDTIKSVMDFGSGYGRVYRALAAAFPEAKLTALDLMEPAAKFCAETFGGDWVKSDEEVNKVILPRKYDLVWLGSVFTHLPLSRWDALLDFLHSNTEPEGLVIFSTHGFHGIEHIAKYVVTRNPNIISVPDFEKMRATIKEDGFAFIPNNANHLKHIVKNGIEVSQNEYGFSFSTPAFISDYFSQKAEWQLVQVVEKGWGNNHDAVTIRRVSR